MGNQLLDTTESIALALDKFGVSFSREYCKKGILKKVDSCIDKMIRSGSIGIQDRIRTTLFSKNIYDLSILDKIINEYRIQFCYLEDQLCHLFDNSPQLDIKQYSIEQKIFLGVLYIGRQNGRLYENIK